MANTERIQSSKAVAQHAVEQCYKIESSLDESLTKLPKIQVANLSENNAYEKYVEQYEVECFLDRCLKSLQKNDENAECDKIERSLDGSVTTLEKSEMLDLSENDGKEICTKYSYTICTGKKSADLIEIDAE